jgi:hypothetical protein
MLRRKANRLNPGRIICGCEKKKREHYWLFTIGNGIRESVLLSRVESQWTKWQTVILGTWA